MKRKHLSLWIGLLTLLGSSINRTDAQPRSPKWFTEAKFGVFVHFLGEGDEFFRRVESFDADRFAEQVEEIGAGYVVFTLGQNSGYYCSPNAAYEKLAGYRPGERCSKWDLPRELAEMLLDRDIRLMLYLPSRSPQQDKKAMASLGDANERQPAPQEFTGKWSEVIQEWSLRYDRLVSGWWFDGAYNTEGWDDLSRPNNWKTWAAACRAGNPNSILAFNRGADITHAFIKQTDEQDYTAGEQNEIVATPKTHPAPDGLQWHVLTYLGSGWSKADGPRFSDAQLIEYVKTVRSQGGVVTLDVHVEDSGAIYEPHYRQLKALGEALK